MLKQVGLSSVILAAAIASSTTSATAITLTDGDLSVDIREDNGAIGTLLFGGRDFYNPGTPVSDWILQVDTDTSTFSSNTTSGGNPIGVRSVTADGNGVSVLADYVAGGSKVRVERNYSLISGADTLRTTTTLTNFGQDLTIALADTFDPDQAAGEPLFFFGTRNDIDNGTARSIGPNGFTVEFSGLPSSYNSNDLGIFSGEDLNQFFANDPFDPNGTIGDIGVSLGVRELIASGDSLTVSFDQAYSLGEPFEVPEPATMLGSLALLGIGAFLKRKYAKQQIAR
ncbi:hypothetical protein C1752_10222 [Acaryochloris thomasi RCC1774]|uniref:Uncharacterized protein n=1 Tax=Acaryochloris thomasi RCC1774 TaxID=1764569 RepID=A0A2W1JP88_9CYAN|nr:PEP-CTERM sorting domain-containing protein [Acaryochloris thomasi]PZD70707.1 hypothetical protein C1752_10222 [Acaryochloris thomasi RCC1774]